MGYTQSYAQQPVSRGPHQPALPPHGAVYEHRHSYYEGHPAPVYGSYEQPQERYYARGSYSGYEAPYVDIRFQHNVGPEHSPFNRKRRGNLPREATNLLKEWFQNNRQSPYPGEETKLDLCNRTGLSLNQVRDFPLEVV